MRGVALAVLALAILSNQAVPREPIERQSVAVVRGLAEPKRVLGVRRYMECVRRMVPMSGHGGLVDNPHYEAQTDVVWQFMADNVAQGFCSQAPKTSLR